MMVPISAANVEMNERIQIAAIAVVSEDWFSFFLCVLCTWTGETIRLRAGSSSLQLFVNLDSIWDQIIPSLLCNVSQSSDHFSCVHLLLAVLQMLLIC
mmetsp:Transcript_23709/g.77184  ORF Transcript_23709/g.77184 Transcript_23709/m.77184 type:complete len:98 (-) Transcript_23709:984-1277(-)